MSIRVLVALVSLAAAAPAQILFDAPVKTSAAQFGALSAAVGDLDGDGFGDLVVGHFGPPGLRLGDGAGHFGPDTTIAPDTAGTSVELADLDGDGDLDLIDGSTIGQKIYVCLNQGGGSFAPAASHSIVNMSNILENILTLRVADGDDDGDPDVLAVGKGGQSTGATPGECRLFRNVGGALEVQTVFTPPTLFGSQRVIDGFLLNLNGDAVPDMIVVVDAGLTLPQPSASALACELDGSFAATWASNTERPLAVGDLDGDGDDDVLIGPLTPPFAPLADHLAARLNDGTGALVEGPETSILPDKDSAVAGLSDLDGDGALDLLLLAPNTELWALRGAGDGSFASSAHVDLSDGVASNGAEVGDLDADGLPDVVAQIGSGTLQPLYAASLNRTYGPGPLLDLGHQLEGAHWPIQVVAGSFVAGAPFSFALHGAVPGGLAFHVIGTSLLNAPFKGGTLVPAPLLLSGPFAISAQGELLLAGNWPGAPSGLVLALQFWFADAGGPKGFAASSAVQLTMP